MVEDARDHDDPWPPPPTGGTSHPARSHAVWAAPWPPGPPPPRPPVPGPSGRVPGTQAGFGLRAAGYLVDNLILQIIVGGMIWGGMLVMFFVVLVAVYGGLSEAATVVVFPMVLALVLGAFALQIGYELLAGRRRGQTYGKHLVGTVVVDSATGQPGIGLGRAAVRILARWLSGAIFGIGYLWMLWEPNQRTLHDLLTGTTVVHTPTERTRSPVEFARDLDVVPGTGAT